MFKHEKRSFIGFFILMISLLINLSISGQITNKKGGVCFRVGGNKPIDKFNEYADLFKPYGYHFGFALGLGKTDVDASGYIDGIKALQNDGYELYDLTPEYRTNYFNTKFDPADYIGEPGVDHIPSGTNKICLKFQDVDITDSTVNGQATISGNTVTGNGFSNYSVNDYIYFPDIPLLALITSIIDDNTLTISDVWGDAINLNYATPISYYYLDIKDIHMTREALVLLGNETQRLVKKYGLVRPYRWITPGSPGYPTATPLEIQAALGSGDTLGYTSAQSYDPNTSLKVFNEYDPNDIRRFGMLWGDFKEEDWDISTIKNVIADNIAKHYVMAGLCHFYGNYLSNTEAILQWCNQNDIPVLTMSEWSKVLYTDTQDQTVNIFPLLNVDFDENGIPDGYSSTYPDPAVTIIRNDGPPGFGDTCYSINQVGHIAYVGQLGGIEVGENEFEIWTKGETGDVITVNFYMGDVTEYYRFPADTPNWTKYDLSQTLNGNHSLIIPNSISTISISIASFAYTSGDIRIGGMTLKAPVPTPVELTSFTAKEFSNGVELNWRTATEVNNYGFEIERSSTPLGTIDSSRVETREWETIGFVEGHGNSYSPKDYSFVDSISFSGEVKYRLKQIDTDGTFDYSDIVTVELSIVSVDPMKIVKSNLDQNHPNPFNPSTIISYQLVHSTNVSLKVYDILGNEIVTLIDDQKQNAGTHYVEFNKLSYNLSSGVYFYQLIAGQYVATKKMLLLK